MNVSAEQATRRRLSTKMIAFIPDLRAKSFQQHYMQIVLSFTQLAAARQRHPPCSAPSG
jgi:hypothetical protein